MCHSKISSWYAYIEEVPSDGSSTTTFLTAPPLQFLLLSGSTTTFLQHFVSIFIIMALLYQLYLFYLLSIHEKNLAPWIPHDLTFQKSLPNAVLKPI